MNCNRCIRRSYFCVCEGQQEEMYLKRIAFLLKKFPQRVITFNTTTGLPEEIDKTITMYDCAALFDHDLKEKEFHRKIETCEKLRRKYHNKKKVYHAYSNVNFDLWLILHKEDYCKPVFNTHAYINDVRRIYALSPEADIKEKDNLEKILSQISLEDVKDAIRRAEQIRSNKLESDRKLINGVVCYDNPDFSLHNFIKVVLKECGEL